MCFRSSDSAVSEYGFVVDGEVIRIEKARDRTGLEG